MKLLIVFLGVSSLTIAQQCLPHQFPCDNGDCIPDYFQCDGLNDCGGWEDEVGCYCDGVSCPNSKCIAERRVCDGENDCEDYADETDCSNCPGFTCEANRRCIPLRLICDGEDDCGDGSDETEEACPCGEGEYRCAKPPGSNVPGPCIPPEYVCDDDGIWDCPDGSDEANCTMSVKTRHTKLILRPQHKRTHRESGSSIRHTMKRKLSVKRNSRVLRGD